MDESTNTRIHESTDGEPFIHSSIRLAGHSADDWQAALLPYRQAIEAGLREAVTCPHPALTAYYNMMRYHLGWADAAGQPTQAPIGKRLRPLLCVLACQAAGGLEAWRRALPAAVAVELLHNFSLIHDDIEDGDAERRHRPTVWKVWGAPQAINAGDGLLTVAHLALHQLPAEVLPRQVACFETACLALCQGQYLDMDFEQRAEVTLAEYLFMIHGKTASLFAAAVEMGALLGAAEPAAIAHYREFGLELGLAFQIQDDVLGIWGDPAVTGKPAANDLRQRKKTWPVVYALEHAAGPERAILQEFYQAPSVDEAGVAQVLAALDSLGARARTEAAVWERHSRAIQAVERARGYEPAVSWLRALAGSLVGRGA